MFEGIVMSCKKNEFEDRFNPGRKIVGYNLAVSLPGDNGYIEVWSTEEKERGETVQMEVTEGKNHKPKVRVL